MAERNSEKNIALFQEEKPSLESYWRNIVLFGRNTASYKFSLAESLLDFAKQGKTTISLDELANPFSGNICRHIKKEERQATNASSTFLEACSDFVKEKISHEQLINSTINNGFRYVLDCFHKVNGEELPVRFYEKSGKQLILTDDLFKVAGINNSINLYQENESRWNLVETAWKLNISPDLLNVRYDDQSEILFIDENFKRKDITSARGALDGYQKGKCFYCYDDIIVSDDSSNTCDVDHFFPHTLQHLMPEVNLNGVWNLVLACTNCNRGTNGKFAKVPDIKYSERLHKRNEFLISSHHPLRETIINQTGKTGAKFKFSIDPKTTDETEKSFLPTISGTKCYIPFLLGENESIADSIGSDTDNDYGEAFAEAIMSSAKCRILISKGVIPSIETAYFEGKGNQNYSIPVFDYDNSNCLEIPFIILSQKGMYRTDRIVVIKK